MRTFFVLLFCISTLFAETSQEIVQKTNLANINSILIFTSQDAISSGTYNFTSIGATMDIYHIPFIYQFNSKKDYNFFILGNVGYSRSYISNDADYNGTLLNYNTDLRTYTAGIGGGIRYKITSSASLLGGMEFIYSRSGYSIKTPHDSVNAAFNNLFAGNDNENITYKFFTLYEYRPQIYDFKPYFTFGYKLYQTKASINYDSLKSFTTQSSVTTATIGVESPKLYRFDEDYVTLESYFNNNYLGGDIQKSVLFDNYATLGIIGYLYTPTTPSFAKRFFIELSTVRSRGLEGYNAGVGFSANF